MFHFVVSDINECNQNKTKCPVTSKCRNTPGSYTCKCSHGFKFKNKRCVGTSYLFHHHITLRPPMIFLWLSLFLVFFLTIFLDVDECKTNSNNRDENALCTNIAGSYTCRCKDGFKDLKDGRQCLKEG